MKVCKIWAIVLMLIGMALVLSLPFILEREEPYRFKVEWEVNEDIAATTYVKCKLEGWIFPYKKVGAAPQEDGFFYFEHIVPKGEALECVAYNVFGTHESPDTEPFKLNPLEALL